jgi:mono/diheme cytochrome c family protein
MFLARRSLHGALLALNLGLVLAPPSAVAADKAPIIVHSNDVLGEIEPCGCRTNPTGGMVRKDRLLDSILDGRTREQLLQLDAGDLFFSTQEIPETLKPQTEIQALALAKALKSTGLRALVPGEKDFALGTSFFDRLVSESGALALAANLEKKTRTGWKHWLRSDHVFELRSTGGTRHRVAVLGIIGKNIALPKDLRVTDATALARKWVHDARKKADWLVVLTHQGFDEDVKLAESVAGIDFVIGAHSQSYLQNPRVVENGLRKTSIHQCSFRNQAVGTIELKSAPESQMLALDASLDPPADQPASELQKLVTEMKDKIAQANRAEEKKISAIVQAAQKEGIPKFQTFTKCADCHFKQFDFWRKTPHASAYEVLVKAGQHQNLECLSCHTVGLNDPEGFSTLHQLVEWSQDAASKEAAKDSKKPALESWLSEVRSSTPATTRELLRQASRVHATVQCENCHGPGRDHPFGLETMPKVVATQSCLKCHTPERAPGWYSTVDGKPKLDDGKVSSNLKKMACPAGDEE